MSPLEDWLLAELGSCELTVDELHARTSSLDLRPSRPDIARTLDKLRIQGLTKASAFLDGRCVRVWSTI